jgi:serine/threonine protein kinase
MELVEGPTLADRIARGALPVDEALPIAKQIAEALEAAHEQGIVHRDLKPANIKIREDGTVRVLDFGLAKAMEPVANTASTAALTNSPTITSPALMTGVGVLLGTAAYMSPEQAKGRPTDKRSDIWAFGCVLFEMLTGHRAFEANEVPEILAEIIKGTPDWSLLPQVSPAIRLLLQRCLEKDRGRRLGDVAAIRLLMSEPALDASAMSSRAPKRGRTWSYVGAAFLVGALASSLMRIPANRNTTPVAGHPVRLSFERPAATMLTNGGRQTLSIAPDGRSVVFVSNEQLFVRALEAPEAVPIRGTENSNPTSPTVSPDGTWVAFSNRGPDGFSVRTIPIGGGVPFTVCRIG